MRRAALIAFALPLAGCTAGAQDVPDDIVAVNAIEAPGDDAGRGRVVLDPPDGLILDATGCAYLWGGERKYLNDLMTRLRQGGYEVRAAMADTIGVAWAYAHYGQPGAIVPPGKEQQALESLPPNALRLPTEVLEKMQKLGFYQIRSFIGIPARVLRRR